MDFKIMYQKSTGFGLIPKVNSASNSTSKRNLMLKALKEKLGNKYKDLFGIILADNSVEFSDIDGIEQLQDTQEIVTKLFFCDPMNTNQKPQCERNHELLRFILPKGTSFNKLTPDDMKKINSHVNSYKKKYGLFTAI